MILLGKSFSLELTFTVIKDSRTDISKIFKEKGKCICKNAKLCYNYTSITNLSDIKEYHNMFVFGTQYLRGASPERDQWERDLANIKAYGFNTIRAWLVWNAIEKSEGEIE